MTLGGENSGISEELHIIFNTIVFNQVIIWFGKEEEEVEKIEKEDRGWRKGKDREKKKITVFAKEWFWNIPYTSFNSYGCLSSILNLSSIFFAIMPHWIMYVLNLSELWVLESLKSLNDYSPKCNEIILSYGKSELFLQCTKRQSLLENVKREKECK